MFEQVSEKDKAEFEEALVACGFSSSDEDTHAKVAVNLARVIWKHQQMKIDDVKYKVHAYTSSLEMLNTL